MIPEKAPETGVGGKDVNKMSGLFGKEKAVNKIVMINLNEILPNPNQPRLVFEEQELRQLADSIRLNGLLQPLTLRKNREGSYELISGERRLRAGKLAGFEQLPCIVVDTDERQSAVFALIENIQRADLNFFEEAKAIQNLIVEWNITQEETSARLGKAQSTVANKLRLLKLTEAEQQTILQGGLTERHARALLKIEDPALRREVTAKIIQEKMNVIRAEAYIERRLAEAASPVRAEKRRVLIVKDVRLFLNTINKALDTMKRAGIPAQAEKKEDGEYIEYLVRIPLTAEGSGAEPRAQERIGR